jgi:hypothetical protein
MNRSRATLRFTLPALAGLLVLGASAPSPADDFVDSRLTVTFGDDDLLQASGETIPDSPRVGFGDRPGYELFYDNLNTRFSSRETLTHLVFYRKLPAYFDNVTTEAAVVMRVLFAHAADENVAFEDTGSYIRVSYNPWDDPQDGLSLVAFPFNADRLRLGYLYRLSLGGNEAFSPSPWFAAPGFKLQLDLGPGFYYGGFKAIPIREDFRAAPGGTVLELSPVEETNYAVLGGMGWDLLEDQLRLEAAGGYFQQGGNPIRDVIGELVYTVGGAARVVWHQNLPVEDSIDFALYRNDPNHPFLAFKPATYTPGEWAWLIAGEVVGVAQRLADTGAFGETTLQPALAAALRARLQYDYFRLEATGLYRDLTFLTHNLATYKYVAFPDNADLSPEGMAALAGDYHFPDLHLTLGLSAGLLFPAHLTLTLMTSPTGGGTPQVIGRHTMVVTDGMTTILPEGDDPLPLLHSRLSIRLDISEMLYTQVWVQYRHDPNRSTMQLDSDLTKVRYTVDADMVGLGIQAAVRL